MNDQEEVSNTPNLSAVSFEESNGKEDKLQVEEEIELKQQEDGNEEGQEKKEEEEQLVKVSSNALDRFKDRVKGASELPAELYPAKSEENEEQPIRISERLKSKKTKRLSEVEIDTDDDGGNMDPSTDDDKPSKKAKRVNEKKEGDTDGEGKKKRGRPKKEKKEGEEVVMKKKRERKEKNDKKEEGSMAGENANATDASNLTNTEENSENIVMTEGVTENIENAEKMMGKKEPKPKKEKTILKVRYQVDPNLTPFSGEHTSCCHLCLSSITSRPRPSQKCTTCNTIICKNCLGRYSPLDWNENNSKPYYCPVCMGVCCCKRCVTRGPPKVNLI
eukprot:TRINITY_DN7956_c0_g2_i1.p1 TRINITY_DN7956_c0_g2~~TRINITY_DN7956_c0_g2_i1.p1  ORF type:complete len:333 (-),score=121.35 TRINITY_DN7956_c0_g2_i1:262-1260(-)